MKRYLRERLRSLRSGDSGFTLVELLVVVGIIVALAAVIIPNVASFANKGEEGALAAEQDALQASIDAFMADHSYSALPDLAGLGEEANDAAAQSSSNDFSTATGLLDLESVGPSLGNFMRSTTTSYFYCWSVSGLVTEQDLVSEPDCTR